MISTLLFTMFFHTIHHKPTAPLWTTHLAWRVCLAVEVDGGLWAATAKDAAALGGGEGLLTGAFQLWRVHAVGCAGTTEACGGLCRYH